jgi:hypothetical protein
MNFKLLIDAKKDLVGDGNSCKQENGTKKSKIIRPYERNGAIDRFNLKYCEFMVLEKLQPSVNTAKDTVNMYYKRVETLIDSSDDDYNSLSR